MASEHETKSSNGSNSPYSDLGASDLLEKIPQQPCVSGILDPRNNQLFLLFLMSNRSFNEFVSISV